MVTKFSMKTTFSMLLVAAALCSAGSAKAATLILDGDFANTSPTFTTENNGTAFGPWTVTSGSVDLIGGYWQSPTPGGGSLDIDGNSNGSIAQTFTAPAGNYVFTFDLSGNPDGPPITKSLEVQIGSTTETFNYTLSGNTHADMMYIPETFDFTSTGAPLTLSFLSLDNPSSPYGAVIGDVAAVSAAPLPPGVWLFASALMGLMAFAWMRSPAFSFSKKA
jgi:choice-of-anchor C domain-containing protein